MEVMESGLIVMVFNRDESTKEEILGVEKEIMTMITGQWT